MFSVCAATAVIPCPGRAFDGVVDTTLYNGEDAKAITELLDGSVGHYIFLSTGQVYLVRRDLRRPFAEDDYDGPIIDSPPQGSRDHEEWAYGGAKRQAEDVLRTAWETRRFPCTALRLPMVNSERDHFYRIYGYLLRLRDGGPILVPAGDQMHLRHVYGGDVVRAIATLIHTGLGKGRAYNLSQEEALPLEDFLALLASMAGHALRLARIDKALLESHRLLPDCSPFSDPWMSELDNRRSKDELGMRYTPLPVYLRKLIRHYESHPLPTPVGYQQRGEEIRLVLGA